MELDSMEKCNPRGYMELVKSMRDGGFDKAVPDDTSSIPPSSWHIHFSNLLAKKVDPEIQNNLKKLITENIDNFQNELSEPFSTLELSSALKELKNNKASSFDRISNEMLKTGGKILKNAFLRLFNSIRVSSFYPSLWKKDILYPIHKSEEKDDPEFLSRVVLANCLQEC